MKKLKINEIFYSIQGEGVNSGMAAIFIRLAQCNLKCSYCDTEFESFTERTVDDILDEISLFPCKNIIWTGGEPTLQLDNEILSYFDNYWMAIETNGTNSVPSRINYISCSPKVSPEILNRNFKFINEIRYPMKDGVPPPNKLVLPLSDAYLLSPIFNEDESINKPNLNYCIKYIQLHPEWRLSVQLHKLIGVQ